MDFNLIHQLKKGLSCKICHEQKGRNPTGLHSPPAGLPLILAACCHELAQESKGGGGSRSVKQKLAWSCEQLELTAEMGCFCLSTRAGFCPFNLSQQRNHLEQFLKPSHLGRVCFKKESSHLYQLQPALDLLHGGFSSVSGQVGVVWTYTLGSNMTRASC